MKTKRLLFLFVLLVLINKPILAQVNADVNTTYLFYTCKVWGYLKYFHSSLADGQIKWDDVLIKNLPKLNGINSKEAFNDYLWLYFNMFSPMSFPIEPKPIVAEDLRYNLNTNWFVNEVFTSSTTNFLLDTDNEFRPRSNYYITSTGPGNPLLTNDNQYYNAFNTTRELRLLGLFRYWNIINYFYPYKNIIDKNWDDVLREFIPQIVNATDEVEYNTAILGLAANINDSHGRTNSTVISNKIQGLYYLPIKLSNIQEETVVSEVGTGISKVKKGDVVKSINGISIDNCKKKFFPIIYGSNPASIERNMCIQLIRFTDKSPVIIEIGNENGISKASLDPVYATEYNSHFPNEVYTLRTVEKDKKKIGIVNMGLLTVDQIPTLFDMVWDYDAIIFDIRNYPKGTMWYMINYLFPEQILLARFTVPDVKYPGTLSWISDSVGTGDFSKNYQKRIYLLFNEYTQSQAEYTIMALEQHPNAIKIGSQTAGADGNISTMYLPGGISCVFTGLGTFYPDYRPTQRIGIVPDIEVKPTIKGIREGKDEVLEAAFTHYFGTNVVEDKNTIPATSSIDQNYPNPFNPETTISYKIKGASQVSLKVYDLLGREIATLVNEYQQAGSYVKTLHATSLPSGVYFYRILAGSFVQTKKMVLMK